MDADLAIPRESSVQQVEGLGHRLLEVGDELLGLPRLLEGLVVFGPPCLEVGREVVIRVAAAVRPDDPDLLAAQPLPQRLENGDLGGDAIDPLDAVLVLFEDDLLPAAAYHAVHRDALSEREVALLVLP